MLFTDMAETAELYSALRTLVARNAATIGWDPRQVANLSDEELRQAIQNLR